ncbi:DNA-binding transcriptional LysR family regulator [Scopulibacillus daqui]|uniref:DNA-binding transcriptional LysR family regulator n=1 Tax=Scopulibacillus daqui TaxID=1469162 RepID=A0ABS2Q085_9BACL|nr:DNA-binding transcriptional LysR family regulator [Scopulibacillus daqui]
MYIEALQTFVTVAEEKNFTRAGEKLLLSQPSVSLHIKNLESEFQTKLFDRSPKHLNITPSGKILYERAKQILKLYAKTRDEIYDYHKTMKGTLKIGASYTIGEYVLPAVLPEFNKSYPDIDIEINIDNTENISKSVGLLQYDIGLIEGRATEKDLVVQPFMEDEMVIVVPKRCENQWRQQAGLEELQNLTWIAREKGSGTRVYMDHILRSYGIRPKQLITISSNHGVKEAVINGAGASILSLWVVKDAVENDKLAIVHLQDLKFTRMFFYVLSPHIERPKAAEAFFEILTKQSSTAKKGK